MAARRPSRSSRGRATAERVQRAVARGKKEILQDMASGRVPRSVRSFATLHDFVDANEYGGMTDPRYTRGLHGPVLIDMVNRVQNKLDAWLRTGATLRSRSR
jgi:hypothetical protein